MNNPLVSVIVLSYNHSRFVEEAISSVRQQNYPEIEIIAIDDNSDDNSGLLLKNLSDKHSFTFLQNPENYGNCKSFNKALQKAHGKYVIDLSADDYLLPDRIKKGVEQLESLPEDYGVHFTDAELIDENGEVIGTHYQRNSNGELQEDIPQGRIFKELLERYFICTPTMMIKKQVLDELGGYDENLSYEDFDFWVRSSKKYRYAFSDEVLVKKRMVKNSHSQTQKKAFNKHISSTRQVCEKACEICENHEELSALTKRINYEMKWALATGNLKEVVKFYRLKKKIPLKWQQLSM